jgi:hypothetical protein
MLAKIGLIPAPCGVPSSVLNHLPLSRTPARNHCLINRSIRGSAMPQLFARPRTPNDNPFVESLFGTVKTAPHYPERFLDRQQAVEYFKKYFTWYNTEHLHSGIDYVTAEQCHRGMREKIVKWRTHKLKKQQQLRKEVNRFNHQQMILSLT